MGETAAGEEPGSDSCIWGGVGPPIAAHRGLWGSRNRNSSIPSSYPLGSSAQRHSLLCGNKTSGSPDLQKGQKSVPGGTRNVLNFGGSSSWFIFLIMFALGGYWNAFAFPEPGRRGRLGCTLAATGLSLLCTKVMRSHSPKIPRQW